MSIISSAPLRELSSSRNGAFSSRSRSAVCAATEVVLYARIVVLRDALRLPRRFRRCKQVSVKESLEFFPEGLLLSPFRIGT